MTCRRISGAVWCRGWTQPGRTSPDRSGPLTGRTNRFRGHCDPLKALRRNRFKITNSRFSVGVSPMEAGTCIHSLSKPGAFSRFFHEHRGQNHPPCPGSGRIRGVQCRRDSREGDHAGRERRALDQAPTIILTERTTPRPVDRRDRTPRNGPVSGTILATGESSPGERESAVTARPPASDPQ
jgi:hypothetical protein